MAISLTPVRPITDEELLQLAQRNPGYQFERGAKGELIVTPAGTEGGRRSMEMLTPAERKGFAPLCPDAVFEIRSESDRLVDLRMKMTAYLKNGARLAVLIDPEQRTVEIHRPDATSQLLGDVTAVEFDPELPGFVLDLRPIFS